MHFSCSLIKVVQSLLVVSKAAVLPAILYCSRYAKGVGGGGGGGCEMGKGCLGLCAFKDRIGETVHKQFGIGRCKSGAANNPQDCI